MLAAARATAGTLAKVTPSGNWLTIAGVGAFWTNGGRDATLVLPATSGLHFTGCEPDPAGNVYFVSIFSGTPFPSPLSGSLIKLAPTGAISSVASGLNLPNKLAIGFDGSIYVSVNSVCPRPPDPAGRRPAPSSEHPRNVDARAKEDRRRAGAYLHLLCTSRSNQVRRSRSSRTRF